MRQSLTALAAAAAVAVLASTAAAQPAYGILPQAPNSHERQAPIDAVRRQGAALAQAFAPHMHSNAGESVIYKVCNMHTMRIALKMKQIIQLLVN